MRTFFIFFFISTLSACSIQRLTKMGVYQEVNPDQYVEYIFDSTVNIIDVRTAAEYEKSHIPNAINISYFGGKFKKQLDTLHLDRTKPTLIYCETQHRSLFVAKILYKKGFRNVIDLNKGMMYWRKKDFPTVQGSAQ